MDVLLVPAKSDRERDAVAEAWKKQDGTVKRIDKFWRKPLLDEHANVALYGNDVFCNVLAQLLELQLHSPDDELLAEIEQQFVKRHIEIQYLESAAALNYPVFIKSVMPKLIIAQVYNNVAELEAVTPKLAPYTELIVSELITIEAEARAFVVDGKCLDIALYEGNADMQSAQLFLADFLTHYADKLPPTVVVDVGYNSIDGWFVIEFNASWGAGLNGCDAEKVLEAIRLASYTFDEDEF